MTQLDNGIISLIIGSSVGILGLIIRFLFYSKCDSYKCCFGFCEIHRVVSGENSNPDMNMNINNNNNNNDFMSINVRTPSTPKKNIEEQKSIRL